MQKSNSVYIGVSLDGYIADKEGGLGFLDTIKIPEGTDMGYYSFMERIDALVMGRSSFETVNGFDIDWPYDKPVFVLSNTLSEIPSDLEGKVFLVKGPLQSVLEEINGKGYHRLYIDGGKTVQSFLQEDLIDELIITTIPILIGGGAPLFGDLPEHLEFELLESHVIVDQIVMNHYKRKR